MNKSCVRCIVQLQLAQVDWQDEKGIDINLAGAPVFIRGCVLGQMHHSHLQKPFFPVAFNEKLTFDRIYTNCRNPSIFSEVIRGEHVKIELIQITPDYSGGKVLAKFESPAHKFLYPPEECENRTLLLSRTKRFKNPPELHFSCTTVLLEATVHSPIHLIYGQSSSEEDQRDERKKPSSSRRLFSAADQQRQPGVSWQTFPKHPSSEGDMSKEAPSSVQDMSKDHRFRDAHAKLNSLLESFRREEREEEREMEGRQGRRRKTIRFQCPSSHRRHRSAEPLDSRSPQYYTSLCRKKGLHDWPDCPRRSNTHSAPSSPICHPSKFKIAPSPFHKKCTPLRNAVPMDTFNSLQHLEHMDPALVPGDKPKDVEPSRPPFFVRRLDEKLIKKRNFCGEYRRKPKCVGPCVVRHSVVPPKPKEQKSSERELLEADQQRESQSGPVWDKHGRQQPPAVQQSKLKKFSPWRSHSSTLENRGSTRRQKLNFEPLGRQNDDDDDEATSTTQLQHDTHVAMGGDPGSQPSSRRFPILHISRSPSPRTHHSPPTSPSPYNMKSVLRSHLPSSSHSPPPSSSHYDDAERVPRSHPPSSSHHSPPPSSSHYDSAERVFRSHPPSSSHHPPPSSSSHYTDAECVSRSHLHHSSPSSSSHYYDAESGSRPHPSSSSHHPPLSSSSHYYDAESGSRSHPPSSSYHPPPSSSSHYYDAESGSRSHPPSSSHRSPPPSPSPYASKKVLRIHPPSSSHRSPPPSPPRSPSLYAAKRVPRSPRDPAAQRERDQLLNKYLSPPRRKSPSRSRDRHPRDYNHLADVIEQKIAKLRRECCACLQTAPMHEDNLTDDLDNLRDTLQEQRDEALDLSSKALPNQSVTIQIGPRDYWSKQMSEMTGKRHRTLFDETLRKIYNKLYTEASLAP